MPQGRSCGASPVWCPLVPRWAPLSSTFHHLAVNLCPAPPRSQRSRGNYRCGIHRARTHAFCGGDRRLCDGRRLNTARHNEDGARGAADEGLRKLLRRDGRDQAGDAKLWGRERYCVHTGSTRSTATRIQTLSCGGSGCRRSLMPASLGERFSLRELQGRQDATTLSHVCAPPRLLGTTWSTFSAGLPQY